MARVIALQVAHHVTQRGNARQFILNADSDRAVYLGLLREGLERNGVSLIGFCLMSNHVHLVMVPSEPDALAKTLKQTHGRYAAYWNAKHRSSGHMWQGRYYSCPLDRPHLWRALRYAELNPVRAGMVASAEAWAWSSAAMHCGAATAEAWIALQPWAEQWDASSWTQYLAAGTSESEVETFRRSTHTGRPLGSEEFIHELEEKTGRLLVPRKGGRPARIRDASQGELHFEP
jgi:putative transposase